MFMVPEQAVNYFMTGIENPTRTLYVVAMEMGLLIMLADGLDRSR